MTGQTPRLNALRAELRAARAAADVRVEMHVAHELGRMLSDSGLPANAYTEGLKLLYGALQLAKATSDQKAEADILINISSNHYNNPCGDLIENKQQAIAVLQRAQLYYTLQRDPENWSKCATNEALCLLIFDNRDNTSKAVGLLEQARSHRAPGTVNWAFTGSALGLAYRKLAPATVRERLHNLSRSQKYLTIAADLFEQSGRRDETLKRRLKAIQARLDSITTDAWVREIADAAADGDVTNMLDSEFEDFTLKILAVEAQSTNPSLTNTAAATPTEHQLTFDPGQPAAIMTIQQELSELQRLAIELGRTDEQCRILQIIAKSHVLLGRADNEAKTLFLDAMALTPPDERPFEWLEWASAALELCVSTGDFFNGSRVTVDLVRGYETANGDVAVTGRRTQIRSRFPMLTRLAASCLCGNGELSEAAAVVENGRQSEVFGVRRTFAEIVKLAADTSSTVCYLFTKPRGVNERSQHRSRCFISWRYDHHAPCMPV